MYNPAVGCSNNENPVCCLTIDLRCVAGICLFVGACIWCDETACDEYTMAITATSGVLCILGGVFLIMTIACGGGGGGGSGGNDKKKKNKVAPAKA